ncbi:MAG: NAD-dependent epimerase/dehydratase family protein [Phycisphaerae bacterium]|nr:NAD-dependent epimerase/dehydratase family protein [Phycisphaerae bacterium]
MPASNILVLGGSGFLSGDIVRNAIAMGHRVWILTRGQRAMPKGVTSLVADRKDPTAFEHAVNNAGTHWDMVIDCIGFAPSDVQMDIAILPPLAKHLVFVSSDFVYEPSQRRFPQNEDTDFYLSDVYGGQKRQCELELLAADSGSMKWSIVRPCHIYGPGSQLGCLPTHGRDKQLIARLKAGEPLRLVGGGYFLQQPLFADDLAQTILSMLGNPAAYSQIFCVAGPQIAESREYYRIIADILGVKMEIVELPVDLYRLEHPESASFLCHRIYDMSKLRNAGLSMPKTPLKQGLHAQVAGLLNPEL